MYRSTIPPVLLLGLLSIPVEPDQPKLVARTSAARSSTGIAGSSPELFSAVPPHASDFLYQMESSKDYDPPPGLERIQAVLLAINSADEEKKMSRRPERGLDLRWSEGN
jgi:hypothetical protein